jgi:hypothetical protein
MEPARKRRSTPARAHLTDLRQLPNVGPAVAADLRLLGIATPADLLGRDPYAMYDDLCRVTGVRQDPCVLDTFIAVTRYMSGEPAKPWWKYTAERNRSPAARRSAR